MALSLSIIGGGGTLAVMLDHLSPWWLLLTVPLLALEAARDAAGGR